MEKFTNEKGYTVLELTKDECMILGFGFMDSDGSHTIVCYVCNNDIKESVYYIPILNDCMDKECYDKWVERCIDIPESDREYEQNNVEFVENMLGFTKMFS